MFPFYKGEEFETWHDYFSEMKRRHGCMFFVENLAEFKRAAQINLVYKEFKIRSRDIISYPVEYEIRKSKKQSGGGFNYGRGLQRLTEEDS